MVRQYEASYQRKYKIALVTDSSCDLPQEIIDDYHLDGAILFATPACKHANAAYRLLADAMARRGLPFLMLDMDISDPRDYSSGQTRTRLEAFVELLEQRLQ